ncbi:MAG: hypothetical protein ACXWQO_01010 [Bdellovibrionota bacterium]
MNGDESTSTFKSWCMITLTNSGPLTVNQDYTINLIGNATGSPGLAPSSTSPAKTGTPRAPDTTLDSTGVSATLAPGASKTVFWDFPNLPAGQGPVFQNVNCTGSILINDTVAASPGFVTANGLLVTWMQSPPTKAGGGSTATHKATIYLVNTPFTIGEGRPF